MKSMRLLQRNAALRQLLEARPTLHQHALRAPLQQSFRTRPSNIPDRSALRRCIHTTTRTQPPLARATPSISRTSPSSLTHLRPRPRRSHNNSSSSNGSSSRRWNSTSSEPPKPAPSLKERLKTMSREYGWTAVGVYLALSALDFPFCFLAVRLIGTDTIGHYEHVVVEGVKGLVKWPLSAAGGAGELVVAGADGEEQQQQQAGDTGKRILDEKSEVEVVNDHGYNAAEKANRGDDASLWTQLALAYAVHKSFIFIRVPLTAAILPKVVKTLRSWGWNIGNVGSRKAIASAASVATKGKGKAASTSTSSSAGVNTKGAKVK